MCSAQSLDSILYSLFCSGWWKHLLISILWEAIRLKQICYNLPGLSVCFHHFRCKFVQEGEIIASQGRSAIFSNNRSHSIALLTSQGSFLTLLSLRWHGSSAWHCWRMASHLVLPKRALQMVGEFGITSYSLFKAWQTFACLCSRELINSLRDPKTKTWYRIWTGTRRTAEGEGLWRYVTLNS